MEDALALTVGVSLDITDSILNAISKSDRVFYIGRDGSQSN